MTRRRLAAVALVATLAGGLASAQLASADPVAGTGAGTVLEVPVDGVAEIDLLAKGKQYWACLALEQVNVGTCIENPLPDPSQLPSLPDLLSGALGTRAG